MMRVMKRVLAAGLTAMMAVTMAAGCGKKRQQFQR